jgi:hypothetical protein
MLQPENQDGNLFFSVQCAIEEYGKSSWEKAASPNNITSTTSVRKKACDRLASVPGPCQEVDEAEGRIVAIDTNAVKETVRQLLDERYNVGGSHFCKIVADHLIGEKPVS